MRPIGSYFELEEFDRGNRFEGVPLNSGRNALRYVLRALDIKKIAIPRYTCPVVWDVLTEENIEFSLYNLDEKMLPILDGLSEDCFILANNYFGVCGKNIETLSQKFKKLIVDDSQSFYAPKMGLAQFNSPRKFFAVSDGGFAICDKKLSEELPRGVSWDRCLHLLKRVDLGSDAAYPDYSKNESLISEFPFARMSRLTERMLKASDVNGAKKIRLENFSVLHAELSKKNLFKFALSDSDVPMAYPLLIENPDLRKKLIDNKIFVASYWPNMEKYSSEKSFELYLKKFLIPLPIDQRYKKEDMERILEVLSL